jgi:glycine/D-amino acid oxidase-like deaminating enzyme
VLINPADVLRALFSAMPENVDIFEECPAMRIDEGSRTSVVLRNGKRVKGNFVLVTGGPFIPEFGISKKVFCPVLSYGAFTRRFTDKEMQHMAGVKPWGCTAGHPAGTTVRFTRDNRIYVRNGFSFATHLTTSHQRIQRAIPKLRRAYENRFPELKHVNFEFIYGGMINMTMNYRPLMIQQHPTIFASASGEGAGVAKTSLLGYYLAEWINGINSQNLDFLKRISTPKRLPPEPFLTMGATARLIYEELNAKKEI